MLFTDDPIADYNRYCNEQQKKLDRLPECSECGEKIMDEYCYQINGDAICEHCMVEYFRKETTDLIG